jgi:hypothetical protein
MLFSPNTNGVRRRTRKAFFLKIALCGLFSLLVAKTAIDLSNPDNTTVDLGQVEALAAEAYQTALAERNLELVEGSLHEPSDPNRICQSAWLQPIGFYGSATLELNNETKVELTISDCHPCAWPIQPGEDIAAYALLDVKWGDNLSFSIESYIGGVGKRSSGSFRILLPKQEGQRQRILQTIEQIGETAATPNRAEFNNVLKELLSSANASINDSEVLRLGALLCKSVDVSLNTSQSPQ